MQTITSIFGSIALLGIIASGFVMMFSPRMGKELIKNIFTAIALFVVGSMLMQTFSVTLP